MSSKWIVKRRENSYITLIKIDAIRAVEFNKDNIDVWMIGDSSCYNFTSDSIGSKQFQRLRKYFEEIVAKDDINKV